MYLSYEFYVERAKEAGNEATSATLDNVRERCERAQRTWSALAEQARKVQISRDKALAAKTIASAETADPN